MLYDAILVDSANLFYRLKKQSTTALEVIKKMINYMDNEVFSHIKNDGTVYILFDPISYTDLGESKSFYYPLNERKVILSDYKSNRKYSNIYLETIELFRKYYLHRGEKVKLAYSDSHEADDYVEPLLELYKDKTVALISNDHDFAGYISKDVHMINESFDKPFTVEEFEKLYEFKPTVAANIVYKSFFGDRSDNITGAIFIKKAKFNVNVKVMCRDYILSVVEKNMTIDEVINQFKTANFKDINDKETKDTFDTLYLTLSIVDLRAPVLDTFLRNVQIIRSSLSGKSIDKYLHSNPVNECLNDIIQKSIYGIPFKQVFGRV